ncbi:MAG: hypothetical protein ACOC34_00815, partial [Thermotogota bacterium]
NCTDQTPRVFSIVNYNVLHSKGLKYFLINEKIDSMISEEIKGNTIMVFSSDNKKRNGELLDQFESLYGMEFELISTSDLNTLILYYKTIHAMLKKRQYYPTPLEALVYIKKQ